MTEHQYLDAFSKGPCSPYLHVFGLTQSSLKAKIDCKKARQNYPELWSTCGWVIPCRTKEITVWLPDKKFLAGFATNLPKGINCLFGLMHAYTEVKDGKAVMEDKGIVIEPQYEGHWASVIDNAMNKDWSKIWEGGVSGLFSHTLWPHKMCAWRASDYMGQGPVEGAVFSFLNWYQELFELLGYKNNLTYMPIAYDWRQSARMAAENGQIVNAARALKR